MLQRERLKVTIQFLDALIVLSERLVNDIETSGELVTDLLTSTLRWEAAEFFIREPHALIFEDHFLARVTDNFFGRFLDVTTQKIRIVSKFLLTKIRNIHFLAHAFDLGAGHWFNQGRLMSHHFAADVLPAERNLVSNGHIVADDAGKRKRNEEKKKDHDSF
jgi:hypothetical protein